MSDPGALSSVRHGLRFDVASHGNAMFVDIVRVADGLRVGQARATAPIVDAEGLEAVIDSWVAHRLGAVVPEPVRCRSCQRALRPEGDRDTDYQFCNALWVTFEGGYGMFVDPIGSGPYRAVICHDCAHGLCDTVAWIDDMIRPLESHSHHVDDIDTLRAAGHRGWDLDRDDDATA